MLCEGMTRFQAHAVLCAYWLFKGRHHFTAGELEDDYAGLHTHSPWRSQ